MAWRFMIRISQRVWSKAANPKNFPETDGYDIDNPVEDTFISARINIYKEVLERDFGILSYNIWVRFISCYNNYFRGIFQCLINWKKTMNRMERLSTFAGATTNENGDEDTLNSRPFDYTINYTCNSVLFSLREFIQRIGVPIEKDTAASLLDSLQKERRSPDASQLGSVVSVSQLATKARHGVACLNELQSISVAKKVLSETSNKAYAVLLPNPEHLGAKLFSMIEAITDSKDGSALLNALHLGVDLDMKKYGSTSIGKLTETFEMTGYTSKCKHPLVFVIGDIDTLSCTKEAETLSEFLGIADEMIPQLTAYLKGEPMDVKGKTKKSDDQIKTEEKHVYFSKEVEDALEMGTQEALIDTQTSIESEVDIGMPEEHEEDNGDDYDDEISHSSSSKRKSSSSKSKSKSRPGLRRSSHPKRPRTRRG
ncbi:MAG: hypothetical protein ACTSUE_06330 [Promethearchaeota archaeon]